MCDHLKSYDLQSNIPSCTTHLWIYSKVVAVMLDILQWILNTNHQDAPAKIHAMGSDSQERPSVWLRSWAKGFVWSYISQFLNHRFQIAIKLYYASQCITFHKKTMFLQSFISSKLTNMYDLCTFSTCIKLIGKHRAHPCRNKIFQL